MVLIIFAYRNRDKDTPIEETMEALHDLVKAGKVRYIGASSMFTWQFAKANAIAKQRGWTQFISMQNHYNAVYREEEREMNPYCVSEGIGLIPWSPLAGGFLVGNRKAGENVRASESFFAAPKTAAATAEQKAAATYATERAGADVHSQAMFYQPGE
jgi:aryl-alcohol dehydrogenase-like predicted oxidoreductase